MKIPDHLVISHQAVRKCFFLFRYITTAYCQKWFTFFDNKGCAVITYTKDDLTEWAFVFSSQQEYQEQPHIFYQYFLREKVFDRFTADIHARYDATMKEWKQLEPVETMTQEQLLAYYNQAVNYFGHAVRGMMTLRLGDLVNLPMIQKQIPDSDLLASICAPTKMSYSLEEEIEFLETTDVERHAQKWQWSSLGYFFEEPLSLQYYLQRKKDIQDQLARAHALREELERREQQQKEQVASLSPDTQWLVYNIQEAAAAKDFLKRVLIEFRYYAEQVFQEIARRFEVEIFYYTPEEVELLFKNGTRVEDAIIRQRHELCITYPKKDATEIYYGADVQEIEKKYFAHDADNASEWSGRIAQTGVGKGAVRILLPGGDLSSFCDGEVLVTNNTTSSFVPIMRRAAAIVAEEGGLTSHTAVVSRELGVPCVVGVAGATQILRNGQIIEVDANMGIVRKL